MDKNINEAQEQCTIQCVMHCVFCGKEINKIELTYTEDAESAHLKCLENFNKNWNDRTEMMDLMGY